MLTSLLPVCPPPILCYELQQRSSLQFHISLLEHNIFTKKTEMGSLSISGSTLQEIWTKYQTFFVLSLLPQGLTFL